MGAVGHGELQISESMDMEGHLYLFESNTLQKKPVLFSEDCNR